MREPSHFAALAKVILSFDFCIRKSVYDPMVDEYGIGLKFLVYMQELIFETQQGIAQR